MCTADDLWLPWRDRVFLCRRRDGWGMIDEEELSFISWLLNLVDLITEITRWWGSSVVCSSFTHLDGRQTSRVNTTKDIYVSTRCLPMNHLIMGTSCVLLCRAPTMSCVFPMISLFAESFLQSNIFCTAYICQLHFNWPSGFSNCNKLFCWAPKQESFIASSSFFSPIHVGVVLNHCLLQQRGVYI